MSSDLRIEGLGCANSLKNLGGENLLAVDGVALAAEPSIDLGIHLKCMRETENETTR